VPLEEIPHQNEPARGQMQGGPHAPQEALTAQSPDQEARVIADDGADGGGGDDLSDGQVVRDAGIDGGEEEHGFAGHGHAHTLDGHEEHDGPDAVGGHQLRQIDPKEHDPFPSSCSLVAAVHPPLPSAYGGGGRPHIGRRMIAL